MMTQRYSQQCRVVPPVAWTWAHYQWDRLLQVVASTAGQACIFIYIIYTHMPAQRRPERSTLSERVRRQRRRNYVYVADRFYAPKSAPAEATTMGQPFSAQAFCFIAPRATTAAVAAAAADAAGSSQSVCACALHRPAASQRAYCDRISGSRPCSLFCIVENPSQTSSRYWHCIDLFLIAFVQL